MVDIDNIREALDDYVKDKTTEVEERSVSDIYVRDAKRAIQDFETMVGIFEDMATYGARHDKNPTRVIAKNDAERSIDGWWRSYLQSVDEAIRDRAKRALGLPRE